MDLLTTRNYFEKLSLVVIATYFNYKSTVFKNGATRREQVRFECLQHYRTQSKIEAWSWSYHRWLLCFKDINTITPKANKMKLLKMYIQRKFTRMFYFKFRLVKPDYHDRLNNLEMQSLISRRLVMRLKAVQNRPQHDRYISNFFVILSRSNQIHSSYYTNFLHANNIIKHRIQFTDTPNANSQWWIIFWCRHH